MAGVNHSLTQDDSAGEFFPDAFHRLLVVLAKGEVVEGVRQNGGHQFGDATRVHLAEQELVQLGLLLPRAGPPPGADLVPGLYESEQIKL
jgi:hypothetical protein